jgi:hypothetical protein
VSDFPFQIDKVLESQWLRILGLSSEATSKKKLTESLKIYASKIPHYYVAERKICILLMHT